MLGPTGAVLGKQPAYDRRQAVLRAFHEQTRELTDAQAILTGVARLLTEQLGVDHFIYGETTNGEAATLDAFHATHGVPQGDPSRRFDLRSAFIALVGGHDWQKSRVVVDNRSLGRAPNHAVQHAADVMNARAGINVPIIRDGRPVALLTVLDTGPRHWTEDEVALCEELAEQTWTALARARAEAALLERERNQAMLIAWSDQLRDEADPQVIIETTLRMLGEHMDVTRATHSESDPTGRIFSVIGEWRRDTISIAGTISSALIAPNTWNGRVSRAARKTICARFEPYWITLAATRLLPNSRSPRTRSGISMIRSPLLERSTMHSSTYVQRPNCVSLYAASRL